MQRTFRVNNVIKGGADTSRIRTSCSCHPDDGDYSGRAHPVAATTNIAEPYGMLDEMVRKGMLTPQRHDELAADRARVLARDDARHQYALPTNVPSIDTVDLSELLPPKAVR